MRAIGSSLVLPEVSRIGCQHSCPRDAALGRVHNGGWRDAEFAVERVRRSGGAEAVHADKLAAVTEPARPIAFDRGLDADPGGGSENLSVIFRRLPTKNIEARRRHDGGADVVRCQQLRSL